MIQPRDEEVRHKCAVLRSAGIRGFLGGPVVKSLPCSAGDTGSILIWEIPHAAEQPSLCATTAGPES